LRRAGLAVDFLDLNRAIGSPPGRDSMTRRRMEQNAP
jgi:hypothetical protein